MKNTTNQIVVVTQQDDEHVSFVQKHLTTEMIVLDRASVVQKNEITLALMQDSSRLELEYGTVKLNNVGSVWLRKPVDLERLELPLSKDYRRYAEFAIRHFSKMVYTRFPDALWISDYYALERASDKGLQLELASKLGFNVPDTIITSSKDAAAQFIATHQATVAKAIECEGLVQNDEFHFFYTNKVDSSTNLEGLHLAPSIFQAMVENAIDIRVTVVGKKVFAASIVGGTIDLPGSNIRDWRVSNYDDSATYRVIELPKKISDLCVRHVEELGLRFGALDLMLDTEGEYWFLENNPNGQWAFVELATGLPIGKALAELLESGRTK